MAAGAGSEGTKDRLHQNVRSESVAGSDLGVAGQQSHRRCHEIPWYEHYEREGFQDISTIHELPYDYSILLENLMDPAHIPISHDRTDQSAKRENAQALVQT